MAKRKSRGIERPISRGVFFLGAGGFGIACILTGALVLFFGSASGREGAAATPPDVAAAGVILIAIGAVALGLTIYILISKKPTRKAKPKKRGPKNKKRKK